MANELVNEIEKLAGRIKAHSLLEILSFQIAAPASLEEIANAESRLNLVIPDPVKNFYQAANGLVLKWRIKPDIPQSAKDQVEVQFKPLTPYPHNLYVVAGNIQLLCLEDLLFNEEYDLPQNDEVNGQFDFEGRIYTDNEFSKMVQPFDIIDDFFAMGFVVQPNVPNWKLMLLSDYWIVYDHSKVTWLDDYMKFVVATWGVRDARNVIFSKYRGDLEPPLTFDESLVSGLVPRLLLYP